MKTLKLFTLATISATMLTVTSCNKSETKPQTDAQDAEAIAAASKQELEAAVADRDELLSLVDEISTGLNDIKQLENIVAADNSETPSQSAQIKQNITALKNALADRRQRLEELEKKLASSNTYTTKLSKTIESMKAQIETQKAEIDKLTNELSQAKTQIGILDNAVDSLKTTVSDVTGQRDAALHHADALNDELNTCYVAVGSKKELKANKILEKKFLSKTKILNSDFNQSFFSSKDKRNFTELNLYSKKAKVLTNHPQDSYVIEDVNGQKVLRITNANRFWSSTSYLVIQID